MLFQFRLLLSFITSYRGLRAHAEPPGLSTTTSRLGVMPFIFCRFAIAEVLLLWILLAMRSKIKILMLRMGLKLKLMQIKRPKALTRASM